MSAIFLTLLSLVVVYGYRVYSILYSPNVVVIEQQRVFIQIPTGSSYNDVLEIIESSGCIDDFSAFKVASSRLGYPQSIKPGRYELKNRMSNKQLIATLRAGLQSPVRLTFTSFRTPAQLAQRVSRQIEADSVEIVAAFSTDSIASLYGFSAQTFIAMFVPNTYEFFWNTSSNGFFDRIKREYNVFWNEQRRKRAEEIGLSMVEVSILASIVQEETLKHDELKRVAGVYMNRLHRRMPLQADPTVKFALGDFGIRRILTRHLQVDSPYNTYKHRGLPPGPINAPSIASIDAVLNFERHQYLYFCARPDYSGYHAFAKTLTEHNRNAREYQSFLNRERIFR